MSGEELKWCQLAHHQLSSRPRTPISFNTVQLKPIIKANFSRRMICSGVSDLAIASVHSEKIRLKKLMNFYTSFFHLLVNGFYVSSCIFFGQTQYLPYIGGQARIKMASASTPSANEPVKVLILVITVQLKPMIKPHFSGRVVSSGMVM